MEMTTEPKLTPRACSCGRVPETYNMQWSLTDSVVTIVWCKNRACFFGQCYPARTLKYWNELQGLITKQRRADFVAGARANGIGNRGPTKEMIEKSFELYLAKEREK